MKKKLSMSLVLFIVVSMLCTTTLSVFASSSSNSGLGILDDTNYYVCVGNSEVFNYNNFLTPSSNNVNELSYIRTLNNIQTSDLRYIWQVDKQPDGTFIFKSFAGNGAFMDLQYYPNVHMSYADHDDFVNFEIRRADNGKYLIINDGKYLTMRSTTVRMEESIDSEFSYWSFIAVNKGLAKYYGYIYDNYNTADDGAYVDYMYDTIGYTGDLSVNNSNTHQIYEQLQTNDITIIAALGEEGAVIIDPNSTDMGKIMADYRLSGDTDIQEYIGDMSANALAKSRCIIYLSSESGKDALGNDGEYYNLVEETYKKGAHFVLGFLDEIDNAFIERWLEDFNLIIQNGGTIGAAVAAANQNSGISEEHADSYIYALGDGTQHLKF